MAPHQPCRICPQHLETHPRKLACKICTRWFRDLLSLDEHYRGSPTHPNCPRCIHKGFFDEKALNNHLNCQHASIRCDPCARIFTSEKVLEEHLLSSSRHPACQSCKTGFKKEDDYHLVFDHTDSFCERCRRFFETQEALTKHWATSHAHSCCEICKLGFLDDFILRKVSPTQLNLIH
ncbi:hypothetical protein K435DRAFT_702967 [Dendrothele bispora CBS 962.96]|uniref:C2H2-type domain-containing protein n=1 Tax=Dendrothele bispora (strain CBS 962.96) TaxID=1314807 RepID=A0A4S8KNE7_DENBC|nr:hypothetical protein K435DRAFT_702967 [Dendrothele bispora CBS 962.96]